MKDKNTSREGKDVESEISCNTHIQIFSPLQWKTWTDYYLIVQLFPGKAILVSILYHGFNNYLLIEHQVSMECILSPEPYIWLNANPKGQFSRKIHRSSRCKNKKALEGKHEITGIPHCMQVLTRILLPCYYERIFLSYVHRYDKTI